MIYNIFNSILRICIFVIGVIISLFVFFGDGEPKIARTNNTNSGNSPTPSPAAPAGGVKNIEISNDDHIRGNEKAKITIVEFSDFECPFCNRFHPTLKQALDEYGDDVSKLNNRLTRNLQRVKGGSSGECWESQNRRLVIELEVAR